jgi:tetratricopeptide (TPR) repeat protein
MNIKHPKKLAIKPFIAIILFIFGGYFQCQADTKSGDNSNRILAKIRTCQSDTCKIVNFRDLGFFYYGQSDFLKSKSYLDSALIYLSAYLLLNKEIKKYELIQADVYNRMVNIYINTDYNLALNYNNKAFFIYKKYDELYQMCEAFEIFGLIYLRLDQFSKALDFHNESSKIIQKLIQLDSNNRSYNLLLGHNCNNFGVVNNKLKRYLVAKVYYNKGLKIWRKINETEGVIISYINIAVIDWIIGNNKMSMQGVDKALLLLTKTKSPILQTRAYIAKSKALNQRKEFTESLIYAKRAEAISKQYNYVNLLKDVYEIESDLCLKQSQSESALHYFKLFSQLKDTLFKEESIKYAFEFKEKYESEKKQKEIIQLTTANNITALEVSNERKAKNLYIAVATAIGLLLALVLVLLNYRSRIRKKEIVSAIELNKQAAQIAKYQSQMNPHFIFNALSNLQNLVVEKNTEAANNLLVNFTKLMRKTLSNSELEYIKLNEEIDYINTYYAFEKSKFQYNVVLKIEIDEQIDIEDTYILPMLIQPFIENCFKHGGFHEITNPFILLKIEVTPEHLLSIHISDNGKGIQHSHQSNEHQSKALSITKRRIELWQEKSKRKIDHFLTLEANDESTGGITVRLLLPLVTEF